jgi:outer membrane murein-binding lipoprotein Lpp
VSSEIDTLRAQVARLQADLDAVQALSSQGAQRVAALVDECTALRGAIVAHLDADHRVDPDATAATRRQLRVLVGWAPPAESLRPRSALAGGSAARRFGLGGGYGTSGGEG